jgi:hypothetical protein
VGVSTKLIIKITLHFMKRLISIFIGILIFNINFGQQLVKTESKGRQTWNYFNEKDSSILIEIVNRKDRIIETRRFKDTTLIVEHGEWIEYYSYPRIKSKKYFDNGFPSDVWTCYNKDGNLQNQKDFNFTVSYTKTSLKTENENQLLQVKDGMTAPVFLGDKNGFSEFIVTNINLDFYTFEKYNKTGKHIIMVTFMVEKDGLISHVETQNSGKKILEKDAVRIIRKSPKWKPAYQNGEPTRVSVTCPIIYVFP